MIFIDFFGRFLDGKSMKIDRFLVDFWSIFIDHREAMKNRPKMADFQNREILDFLG